MELGLFSHCPTDSTILCRHLAELRILIAVFLMFIVLRGLLATLERAVLRQDVSAKRIVQRTTCLEEKSSSTAELDMRSFNLGQIAQHRTARGGAVDESSRVVRFDDSPTVEYILPAYGPDDFYDDPQK